MRKSILYFTLLSICSLIAVQQISAQLIVDMGEQLPIEMLKDRIGTDFTSESEFTGDVSFPLPLVTVGAVEVKLQYNSNVYKQVRADNRVSPSGWVGFGWSLDIGSIIGEIGDNADTIDDRYYYIDGNGGTEIIRNADGIFLMQDYRPWKIKRILDTDGYVLGWEIIKEDGTIVRFGNYNKDSGQFILSSFGPTHATRCYAGYRKLVSNSFSGFDHYIPYQWDLSDVQDIAGNHTTITYQQVQLGYTRESHVHKIKDNKGGEVEFVLGDMEQDEYYNPETVQCLFETKYLDTLKIKRNDDVYKKIVMSSEPQDILNIDVRKRYLKDITIQDKRNKTMPVSKFGYDLTGANPGALMQVIYPSGGKVEYSYKAQKLYKVELKKVDSIGTYFECRPIVRGISGKDFIASVGGGPAWAYRQGATGWYQDKTFPMSSEWDYNYLRISGDYLIYGVYEWYVRESGGMKRTKTGWQVYNLALASWSKVIGTGPNYIVCAVSHDWFLIGDYKIVVVRFTENGLDFSELDSLYKGFEYPEDPQYPAHNCRKWHEVLNAVCGDNYFVLASYYRLDADHEYQVFSHFEYQDGTWKPLKDRVDSVVMKTYAPFVLHPYSIGIGKNFVVCMLQNYGLGRNKIYLRTGGALVCVDSMEQIRYGYGEMPQAIAADNFCVLNNNAEVIIKTWTGSGFSTITDNELFGIIKNDDVRCVSVLGNKLLITTAQAYKRAGLATYSPDTKQWKGRVIEEIINVNNYVPLPTVLSQNMFAVGWTLCVDGYKLRAYQFRGDSLSFTTTIDSVYVDCFSTEQNSYVYMTPGKEVSELWKGDLLAHQQTRSIFAMGYDSIGNIIFKDNPWDYVIEKKMVINGMGDTLITTYKFENGTLDESFTTAKYNKVTVAPPGNNGKTVTLYYNDLKPGQLEEYVQTNRYEEVDGLPYMVKVYDRNEEEVLQTTNYWSAYWVGDTTLGISYQLLDSTKTIQDNVPITKSFKYNSVNLQDSLITEQVGVTTNTGANKDRVTKIKYAFENYPNLNAAGAHMLVQPYETTVYETGGGRTDSIVKTQINYRTSVPYLYLPEFTKIWDGTQWMTTSRIISRDEYGNVKEAENIDGIRTTTKWGYQAWSGYPSTVPIATIINAADAETRVIVCDAFGTSEYGGSLANGLFEIEDNGSTTYTQETRGYNDWCQKVSVPEGSGGSGVWTYIQSPDQTIDYIIEFDFLIEQGKLEILTTGGNPTIQATYNANPYKKQWQHAKIRWNLQNNASNKTVNFIACWDGTPSGSVIFYLDNIRIYPVDAMCTSQTYDPWTLDVISTTDENGVTRYVTKDSFGRQTAVAK